MTLSTLELPRPLPQDASQQPDQLPDSRAERLHSRQQTVLRLMMSHDIYAYTLLEVGIGTLNVTIEFADLGLSDEQIQRLKAMKAKGASLLMFEKLKDAGATVRKRIETLKRRYLTYTGVNWIVVDTQLPQMALELEDIQAQVLQLETSK